MTLNLGRNRPQFISPTSHTHTSDIYTVRACPYEEGLDLLAIGGENRVEILQREDTLSPAPTFKVLASFFTGCQINAIAWSPRSVSPASSPSKWFLELVVAGADNNLRLLLTSPSHDQVEVRDFGSGLSGHHGRISDLCFCSAETYKTHLASVGEDGLILWNLYPPSPSDGEGDRMASLEAPRAAGAPSASSKRQFGGVNTRSLGTNNNEEGDQEDGSGNETEEEEVDSHFSGQFFDRQSRGILPQQSQDRTPSPPQPTAYTITFPHPLHSIAAHANSASQFMVSDSRGTVYLVDWTALDPAKPTAWRGHRVVELTDPRALSDGLTGMRGGWSGGASWKPNDVSIIGATYGTRWCVWDLRKLQGGKPLVMGEGHPQGGHRFRWCPTNPHLFAISTQSPISGAVVKVYHTAYHQSPRLFSILPTPHRVRDFDWLCGPNDATRAWMAVAVGKQLYFVAGGDPLPSDAFDYNGSVSPQP